MGVTSRGALRDKNGGRWQRYRTESRDMGKPISSNASLRAVCSRSASVGSILPPGKATSPGCPRNTLSAKAVKDAWLQLTLILSSSARVLSSTLSSPDRPANKATMTAALRVFGHSCHPCCAPSLLVRLLPYLTRFRSARSERDVSGSSSSGRVSASVRPGSSASPFLLEPAICSCSCSSSLLLSPLNGMQLAPLPATNSTLSRQTCTNPFKT